jgi:3-deoxy-7-phosphoheptulonate synthase
MMQFTKTLPDSEGFFYYFSTLLFHSNFSPMTAKQSSILVPSYLVKEDLPLTPDQLSSIAKARRRIIDIIEGKDTRKILIIGPCSADFEESLLEYAGFLAKIRERVQDRIEIIMRFYTGKPRTIGGWKGIQHAEPGEKPNINFGIQESRRIALSLLRYNLPLADEMLHPHLTPYFEDIYSYLAVGARSTENQYHREVASGLDMPVGLKNPTSGDITIMMNSIRATQAPHHYTLESDVCDSTGNPYAHGILRGGSTGPNYALESIREVIVKSPHVHNPGVIIDCNHENSRKDPFKQTSIIEQTMSETIPTLEKEGLNDSIIKGFMVESYLYDGNQKESANITRGLSLTDPCLGREKSEALILELYELIGKTS